MELIIDRLVAVPVACPVGLASALKYTDTIEGFTKNCMPAEAALKPLQYMREHLDWISSEIAMARITESSPSPFLDLTGCNESEKGCEPLSHTGVARSSALSGQMQAGRTAPSVAIGDGHVPAGHQEMAGYW